MRFRRGATNVLRRDDGLGGNPMGNIIIDHVSASWGLDENMSIYRHVYDRHGDNIARNPSVGMDGDFGFVNNVIFNWWNRSADGGDNKSFYNFQNNYYKPGPITPAGKPISYRILKPEAGRSPDTKKAYGKAYVHGNIVEGNDSVTKDNWRGGVQLEGVANEQQVLDSIRVDQPFPIAKLTMVPAMDAYSYVLENAGATLPKRDPVDKRVVEEVRTGKITYNENARPPVGGEFIKRRLPVDSYKQGIISDISQVGGYPEYKGTPYKDSDNDGIPDSWEKAHGLNPNDASDSPKIAKDGGGYSNIELFLNSVVNLKNVTPAALHSSALSQSR